VPLVTLEKEEKKTYLKSLTLSMFWSAMVGFERAKDIGNLVFLWKI
jgi:hypothetical protein